VLSDIGVQSTEEGTRGSKKRCKQRHQGVTATVDGNDSDNEEVGGSGVACVMTATGSSKHQARPPTDHFERLLQEACPNHAYSIKQKLRDCGMMKNFMVLGSLTQGESDAVPFPEEDVVMMIYDGRPAQHI
jgi:hypothetical protein